MSIPEAVSERQGAIRAAPAKMVPAAPVTRAALARRTARPATAVDGEDRFRMIAEAAYFRAEQRGFVPGHELADWLAAEVDVDALLGDDDRAPGVA